MDPQTAHLLIEINKAFYENAAASFASTRRRVQPGILRLLPRLPDLPGHTWVDLGCGPGTLGRVWLEMGRKSRYLGLDFSAGLLEEARQAVASVADSAPAGRVQFLPANLAGTLPDLQARGPFCGAVCFATLHHLPSVRIREHLLRQVAALLPPGALFALSVWQFYHSPRLLARLQPWSRVGLDDSDLELGDALLDWRAEPGQPPALRYVHRFAEDELAGLAAASGFQMVETFESDGEGGRLGCYQLWERQGTIPAH